MDELFLLLILKMELQEEKIMFYQIYNKLNSAVTQCVVPLLTCEVGLLFFIVGSCHIPSLQEQYGEKADLSCVIN